MMTIWIRALGGVLLALFINAAAAAGESRATQAEAVAMVKKAVAFYKANGQEKAAEAFNQSKGKYVDRDLYIFMLGTTPRLPLYANGSNPRMLGKEMVELRDADGKYFVREAVEVARKSGKGWVDYRWVNPLTNAIEVKSSYVELVGDVVIGAGVYK